MNKSKIKHVWRDFRNVPTNVGGERGNSCLEGMYHIFCLLSEFYDLTNQQEEIFIYTY